jgi:general secretion pathway protein G
MHTQEHRTRPSSRSRSRPDGRRRRLNSNSQLGMTLIEIMVVLAIISLILGGVGVMAFNRFKDAQASDAKNQVTQIHQLVEQFMLQKRKCPKNVQELKAAGIASKVTKDPWGNEYEIHCEQGAADGIEVKSAGVDGTMGTDDDLSSLADEAEGKVDAEPKKK